MSTTFSIPPVLVPTQDKVTQKPLHHDQVTVRSYMYLHYVFGGELKDI